MSGTGGGGSRSSEKDGSTYGSLRGAFLTGVSIVVPVLVTLYVLSIAVDFLFGALSPLVGVMESLGVGGEEGVLLARALSVFLLLGAILVTGLVTRFRFGERAVSYFDGVVASVPGVGAVYTSFRQMGDVLLESDNQSFQEVYLVEFPYDESYFIGFQTADTVDDLEDAVGEDLVSLFLPLAPNPMMGGFLAHIPKERVIDVDMTVEEGVRSVATLGIATAGDEEAGTDEVPVDLREVVDEYVVPPTEDGEDEE
ncbi:MAG: DUF502 domain-containing protein [Halobacteriales archaeon]|nr:DUF502 domain-containing protein [Halobacteriales archaeon]